MCFNQPGIGGFEGLDCGDSQTWRAPTFSVRVSRRYGDITYTTGGKTDGWIPAAVHNINECDAQCEKIPISRIFELYDAILPSFNTDPTPDVVQTIRVQNFISTASLLVAGGSYAQAGLATMAWRLPLALTLTDGLTSEDNMIQGTACQTVNQITLSGPTIWIFTGICGSLWVESLVCLVCTRGSRVRNISRECRDISWFTMFCGEENRSVFDEVYQIFGGHKLDSHGLKTFSILEAKKIKIPWRA